MAVAIRDRIAGLACVGVAALLSAALAAAAAPGATGHVTTGGIPDGFAGPPTNAPRPIDRALEPASAATLVQVGCAAGGSARCWVFHP